MTKMSYVVPKKQLLIQFLAKLTIIPKPEKKGDFGGASLIKPPFGVTSAGWSL